MKEKQKLNAKQNFESLLGDFQNTDSKEWEKLSNKLLNNNLNDYICKLYENIETKHIYFKEDTSDLEKLTIPCLLPINNRIISNKLNKWEIAQYIPLPFPEEFNKSILDKLLNGQNAISIKLDEASSFGFNPEDSIKIKVGREGTSIFMNFRFTFLLLLIFLQ